MQHQSNFAFKSRTRQFVCIENVETFLPYHYLHRLAICCITFNVFWARLTALRKRRTEPSWACACSCFCSCAMVMICPLISARGVDILVIAQHHHHHHHHHQCRYQRQHPFSFGCGGYGVLAAFAPITCNNILAILFVVMSHMPKPWQNGWCGSVFCLCLLAKAL